MSTEREVGSTGPQGEQPSGGQGVVGPAHDGPAQQSASAAATPAQAPADRTTTDVAPAVPAAPAAPAAGGSTPTLAFSKISAPAPAEAPAAAAAADAPVSAPAPVEAGHPGPGYIDAPPPVVPPAPAGPPAAPALALAEAPALPTAPVAPAVNPYATTGAPAAAAHDPYGAPPAAAHDPYGAPAGPPAQQHPFGAGQPLGGWGPHDSSAGGAGGPGHPGGPLGYPPEYPGTSGPGGPRKKRGGLVALIAAVALVAGVAGGALGVTIADRNDNSASSANDRRSTTVQANSPEKNEPAPGSVAGIAQKALPSVVTIKAQGNGESGTGTGFVFDTEGHILTNNHVVAPASNGGKLTVKFADGSSYNASVLGRAEGYDVAVVKLDNPPKGDKLTPLPLADSDKVNVGDSTIAIGAPYGLESTVTTGIISAKDRPVASGDETGAQSSYMNALQTDASINPGNSGGPLLDSSGAVVGINSAIQSNASSTGRAGSIGLGFAIPINQAKWVAETLIKTGKPVYAKLDVLRNDDYKGDGAQIQTRDIQGTPAVTPGGAADKAGLKPGDVITKLGGSPIENGPALVSKIWTHKPGETVDVEYTRNGQTFNTKVTLTERVGD
ncbi:trypsin-like peptidase domain-containing protein [Kitasatospora sp. NPDC088351]|uniref:S1C family serine protease n=1 Tax=Kitasatospora sp. NPDC088351 TaxID=3155180 RepID=UPI0034299C08